MKAYELVTNEILSALDSGVIPWRRPWVTGAPKSMTTKKEYRGINILILSLRPYSSRYWVTYKEAQKQNGQVRAGERGTPVVYWHWRTKEEIQKLIESGVSKDPAPCIPFISKVFNFEQVEGLTRPEDDAPLDSEKKLDRAEDLLKNMPLPPEVSYGASFVPCYKVLSDRIEMPLRGQFDTIDGFYSTLFHETTHATGHMSRLGRFKTESDEDREKEYSFEELVAEFGACFLSSLTGIDSSRGLKNSASYIRGWSMVFKQDKTIVLKAASQAQRAVDFITRKEFTSRAEPEDRIAV